MILMKFGLNLRAVIIFILHFFFFQRHSKKKKLKVVNVDMQTIREQVKSFELYFVSQVILLTIFFFSFIFWLTFTFTFILLYIFSFMLIGNHFLHLQDLF
mgnify:CR=1 FL=1